MHPEKDCTLKLSVYGLHSRKACFWFELAQGEEIKIGRSKNNHIVIRSTAVSKHHCTLILSDSKLQISEERSTGGIMIAGKLVRPPRLWQPEERLYNIGNWEFSYEIFDGIGFRYADEKASDTERIFRGEP